MSIVLYGRLIHSMFMVFYGQPVLHYPVIVLLNDRFHLPFHGLCDFSMLSDKIILYQGIGFDIEQ